MEINSALLSVLIIENDALTAELYCRELRRYYQVMTCDNESAAFSYIQTNEPSAIVLEPVALGKTGWDFITRLKSLPNMKSVPVILCSTLDERRKGIELGAASFLLKPVLPSTLLQVLRQLTQT